MLFSLYDQRFPSYELFCPNYLNGHWVHPESKVTIHLIHVLLYPWAQINALFALWSTVSELWTVLSKVRQRSLSAPRIKSDQGPHTCTPLAPGTQINVLFALRSTVSELCYPLILSKVLYVKGHWVHPESKVTRDLIHVLHYPSGPKLTLFSLYDKRFSSYGTFYAYKATPIDLPLNQYWKIHQNF